MRVAPRLCRLAICWSLIVIVQALPTKSETTKKQASFGIFEVVNCQESGQKPITLKGSAGKEKYCLAPEAIVDQRHLQSARGSRDDLGEPRLELRLTEQGGQLMQKATRRLVEEHEEGKGDFPRLAILVNGELLSAPTLRSVIVDALVVQGNFSQDDVDELVELLTGKGKDRIPGRQKRSLHNIWPSFQGRILRHEESPDCHCTGCSLCRRL